jgi:hypothetical protein
MKSLRFAMPRAANPVAKEYLRRSTESAEIELYNPSFME